MENKKVTEFKSKLKEKGLEVSDFEEYIGLIEDSLEGKKYGLVWEEHTEEVEKELKNKTPVLKEEESFSIYKGEEYTNNLLIEGDNLESLTYLKNKGKKVDVIYIDPPYNTGGGKGFKYLDAYVDREDSYRHSKWISFMEKRLKIARELLTEDGVIFISIDDRELYNLKLLCDFIFGERNFVANMVRNESPKRQKIGKVNIKTEHEYLVMYSKNKNKMTLNMVENEGYSKYVKEVKTLWNKLGSTKDVTTILKGKLPKDDVTFINSLKRVVTLQELNKGLKQFIHYDSRVENVYREADMAMYYGSGDFTYNIINPIDGSLYIRKPKKGLPLKSKMIKEGYFKENIEGDLEFDTSKVSIEEIEEGKYSVGSFIFKNDTVMGYKYYLDVKTYPVTVMDSFMGSDDRLLKNMGINFNYPKRVDFVKYIISLKGKTLTVLDFFAGSGTTGHAVLELNKEDGGNRNFILCTNNENNICREVTYERLNKVINGYVTPRGKEVEGIPSNLRYYKTELIEKEDKE